MTSRSPEPSRRVAGIMAAFCFAVAPAVYYLPQWAEAPGARDGLDQAFMKQALYEQVNQQVIPQLDAITATAGADPDMALEFSLRVKVDMGAARARSKVLTQYSHDNSMQSEKSLRIAAGLYALFGAWFLKKYYDAHRKLQSPSSPAAPGIV